MSGAKITARVLVCASLLWLWLPSSHALSCQTQTMEQSYEQASQVFLAQIISTKLIDGVNNPSRLVAARVGYRFRLIETFKGEVDYDTFETGLAWSTNAAHFSVGDTSLFFMDEKPGFTDCTPQYLLGQPDTSFVLKKLRSLNRGVVSSISGSWATKSGPDRCSIYTTYLLEEMSGSVSMSLGFTRATESQPAKSSIWVYSQARDDAHVIGYSGLVLSFAQQELAVPYDEKPLRGSANFYSRLKQPGQVDRLLNAVLSQKPVYMSASTRNDQAIEIPVLLNGGAAQFIEFAQCANLELAYNPQEP